ncbi:MAG TPA: ABC transporter ATP-binding protein [Lacipirellulaceae bacterium]|jgi:capsular polysaccharide transport system ATP-binding protein|nr:ABC transporter ATP-binding protein [Lacipirellulaceae bacterium]
MIHLIEVTKEYPTAAGARIILYPTSLSIPTDRGVAVLGRNGAGKSTLLKMISGVEAPDSGQVVRTASVSWPLGLSGGASPTMSGRQNARFVASLNGADEGSVDAFVEEFSELGPYYDEPVLTYSSGMRSRLNFGISFAIDFDCYLIDEATSAGDQWFRDKCLKAFEERRGRSGLLMVSHNPQTIRQYCDIGMVLYDGYLVPFANLEDAINFYCHGYRQ